MNNNFPRILTFLRKERGISQKEAAASLHISQALLSHYEKGIRECGLDFVVRVAEFYDVSCDYLLGRTADKSGAMISVDEIPDMDGSLNNSKYTGSVLPTLHKKLILNSVTILFDLLQRYNDKELTVEAAAYLNLAVYTVFRTLYTADTHNPASLFSVPDHLFMPSVSGAMGIGAATLSQRAKELDKTGVPSLIPDNLAKAYPLFASSLLNLLKNAEGKLKT